MKRVGRVAALVALAALGGCASVPDEEDPLLIRLNDLDARVARTERIVNNQSLVELADRVAALQTELRTLRGQVEELENAAAQLRKQQLDLYADLDKRIAGDAARAGASNGAAAPPAVPAGDPQQLDYSRAFDALKAARYNDAIAGFKEFLARYPTGALADNAQYWLAETYYVTRQYDLALAAFAALERNWPDSAKRADAQLKRGFTLYELNRLGEARAVLSEVAQRYPGSEVARLAEERLRRIPAHAR